MAPIIEAKNVSKQYKINPQYAEYIALRDILTSIIKNPFRFLGAKAKQIVGLQKKEEFWALKNVTFSIEKGEVVGIIGANGAGKSTLLKILTGITPPTQGEIVMRGSVSSLLEVGTGFHPELTGRENIFLNGAILGMGKKEISRKFDEIVEFAGVGKFLDTPVKHFSSGMYVRLAFSVAAHMEPDILLVDEVLAVGDAEFQKKCLGKMEEVTRKEGRTILFVSHNMAAVQQLCSKSILLKNGSIEKIGATKDVVEAYITSQTQQKVNLDSQRSRRGSQAVTVRSISFKGENGKDIKSFTIGKNGSISLDFDVNDKTIDDFHCRIGITPLSGQKGFAIIGSDYLDKKISTKSNKVTFTLKKIPLNAGTYSITIFVHGNQGIYDWIKNAATFSVAFGDYYGHGVQPPPADAQMLLDFDMS